MKNYLLPEKTSVSFNTYLIKFWYLIKRLVTNDLPHWQRPKKTYSRTPKNRLRPHFSSSQIKPKCYRVTNSWWATSPCGDTFHPFTALSYCPKEREHSWSHTQLWVRDLGQPSNLRWGDLPLHHSVPICGSSHAQISNGNRSISYNPPCLWRSAASFPAAASVHWGTQTEHEGFASHKHLPLARFHVHPHKLRPFLTRAK